MARFTELVNTRKLALVKEYIESADWVAQEGFTEDYFTVYGDRPEVGDARVTTIYASGEVPEHRVHWRDAVDRQRALTAMHEDFRETYKQ
ncbi:hypothetical protein [Microbacterium sp.]|uniref:hypothetical protein n=1 Tax=Microbacterium sp. TaxID=51671 RepID=UPI003A8F1C5A